MKSTRTLNWLTLFVLIVSMLLAACGGEEATATPEPAAPEPTEAPAATNTPAPTKEPVAEFECTDEFGCVTVAEGENLRIATALVISGPNESLGIDSQRGVEIAIDDRQEALGFPIELVAEDGGCSAEGGQTAATKITSDETIVAVVGHNCSSSCTPAAPIYDQAGFTMISPSCTAPALTAPDSHEPSFLRTCHNDKVQGSAAAEFFYNELGIRSAATIHDGSPYAEQLQQVFADTFRELGGEITAQEAVNVGDTDMRPLLTSIAVDEPELIYYPIFVAEGGFITVQAREVMGEEVILAGADGMISPDFVEAAGDAGEGMYITGPNLTFENELGQHFQEVHQEKYGEPPISAFHAHAWDAAMIIFDAIEKVGVVDTDGNLHVGRKALRDEVYATVGFDGITGSLTCDDNGDCADPSITVNQIQDGEYVGIWNDETGFLTAAAGEEETGEEAEPSGEPKILRVRLNSDMMDLDPAFIPQNVDDDISNNIHQGLIAYPGTFLEVEEILLAEPLKVSEDGLQIEFKLREGVQFHKGYGELTAEDVKFSYERFLDPELDPPYRDDWAALDRVEVTGKYTGIIILKEPFAPLWTSTMPVQSGWIVSKKAMEEMGHEEYATNPIGTGPYEFVEWVPNQRVVIKRFEDYWGDPPEWDEIHFLPIPENSAAEIALESGEVDFTPIGTDAVERFESNPDFEVFAVDTPNYTWIAMNVQHPNLEDINIRKAIRAAIDVESIIEAAYDGKHARACALVAPSLLGYWPEAPCYERDVEQARAYLAEAGVDSWDVTLTYENTSQYRTIAEIVQANLAEVGINVELRPQDGGLFWEEGYGEEGAEIRQLAIMAYATNPDPAWDTVWFTCEQVVEWNWMYWCNEEYDRLHEEGMRETDQDARREIYIEMQKLMDEAAHSVWISYPTEYYAAEQGLVPSILPSANFMPWRFTTE